VTQEQIRDEMTAAAATQWLNQGISASSYLVGCKGVQSNWHVEVANGLMAAEEAAGRLAALNFPAYAVSRDPKHCILVCLAEGEKLVPFVDEPATTKT
jgi:hypothetical protein